MKSFQNAILHLRGDTQKKEKFVRKCQGSMCVEVLAELSAGFFKVYTGEDK